MVDTLTGADVWLEFEPGALAQTLRAVTPQAAVALFLDGYGRKIFGIGLGDNTLDLLRSRSDGDLTHFRYQQRSGGYAVLGGQLTLHVARVTGGYTIRSANGWLVPDVAVPAAPTVSPRAAELAALSNGRGSLRLWDSTPVVVPHEEGTRLAYLVPVFDSTTSDAVTRFVDAQNGVVFGQVSEGLSFSPRSKARPTDSSARPAPEHSKPHAAVGSFVQAEGTDALEQVRQFVVWNTGSILQMRDNSHAGTAEVMIHNQLGASISTDCPTYFNPELQYFPLVQRSSTQWPNDSLGQEEVSAIHNVGETVTYFKSTFGRDGMQNNASATTWACVHGSHQDWNARYDRGNRSVIFRKKTGLEKTSAAGQDVVTHEFTHGVSHTEVGGSGFDNFFATATVNEALSDYFGARQTNQSCIGFGTDPNPCREIDSTLTVVQRQTDAVCGIPGDPWYPDSSWRVNPHCVGGATSSALWASTMSLPPAGDTEVDWATYNGLRDYIASSASQTRTREAVVRAAKDREHNNQSLYPIVSQLETQYFNRALGNPPVTVSLAGSTCTQWTVGVSDPANRTFGLTFYSGSGLNQDGSVSGGNYSKYLGSFVPAGLPAFFAPSSVDGHAAGDGHWHAMRAQYTALNQDVGFLDYYAGHVPYCDPFIVTPTAPTFVTVKTTYQLTGSANNVSTGWLWEQSYNGGAFGFWSNQQNSSFLAYNGTYTLDWRLSAARTYDNARDTGYTTTQVCIPFNPSCYAIRAAGAAAPQPDSTAWGRGPKAGGDHFGSGLWIALPQGAQRRLIRMYSFSGQHDSSTAAVPWPNILERDGGDWTYASPSGVLTLATRRHAAGDHRSLLRVSGRLAGRGNRTLSLGLAADPDLGEPADDLLGFDSDLGLVWVRDSTSGRHLGYLTLASNGNTRVQQFGAGLGDAPEAPGAARRLMTGPTRVAAGQLADVRFLLSGPEVAVRGDGGFDATFALLRAASEGALFDLARATLRDAAVLLAAIPGQPLSQAVDAFALRQSVRTSSLAASATGSGSGQSSIAQLQADGLTALDYSVPTGQEVAVRIRLYNSRGQLVRTLVDQQVAGGSYHVEWDRLNERGQRVSPGVYVAVMEAGGFRATRKLVVTR